MDKYKALGNDIYFGFEIFEEILKVVKEREHPEVDMFNFGLASADAAIRRLREEHYESISKLYEEAKQ